jgi:phosphotransferase system HPr (HPr) family protein
MIEPAPTGDTANVQDESGSHDESGGHQASVTFPNRAGLHARSAALLIRASTRYRATVTLDLDGRAASASSLVELLKLGARKGHVVRVRAVGPDAEAALNEITTMIANGFNEE